MRRHRIRHFWRRYGDFLFILFALVAMAVAVVLITRWSADHARPRRAAPL